MIRHVDFIMGRVSAVKEEKYNLHTLTQSFSYKQNDSVLASVYSVYPHSQYRFQLFANLS